MEPIYRKKYFISATQVNCFDRLKNSQMLAILQEVAGDHSALLGTDWDTLSGRDLFWAVIRYRVEIQQLPRSGEEITVETWPMPTTRTAYPRATVAYNADGKELFRGISLWVLMSLSTRAMVLPGKSGVQVDGCLRGSELSVPDSLLPKELTNCQSRTVRFSDLDINGHMNNCRYMEWVDDLLPAAFHAEHSPKELVVCYLSEAREGESMDITWELTDDGALQVDAQRQEDSASIGHSRVFSAQVRF